MESNQLHVVTEVSCAVESRPAINLCLTANAKTPQKRVAHATQARGGHMLTRDPTEGTSDPTEGTSDPTEGTSDPTEGTNKPTAMDTPRIPAPLFRPI